MSDCNKYIQKGSDNQEEIYLWKLLHDGVYLAFFQCNVKNVTELQVSWVSYYFPRRTFYYGISSFKCGFRPQGKKKFFIFQQPGRRGF